jgi:hypothetical protein
MGAFYRSRRDGWVNYQILSGCLGDGRIAGRSGALGSAARFAFDEEGED